jgi:tRNA-specific 2-thiouridylase
VVFDETVQGVTPGQAAVFYRNDQVLGGGWIERALKDETHQLTANRPEKISY